MEHHQLHALHHNISLAQNINASASPDEDTYFSLGSGWLVAHVTLMILAWAIVLPIGVMLGIYRSKLHVPFQMAFNGLVTGGVICAVALNETSRDLYPNNAHHKIGWIFIWTLLVQVVFGLMRVLFAIPSRTLGTPKPVRSLRETYCEVPRHSDESVRSHDSGHEENGNISSLDEDRGGLLPSSTSSATLAEEHNGAYEKPANTRWRRSAFLHRLHDTIPQAGCDFLERLAPAKVARVVHSMIGRIMIPFGYIQICTGIVTATGLMHDTDVFNGLAHFIKGGIFFWYGVISLGRWSGAFSEMGWAWNVKPDPRVVGRWTSSAPTAELVESSVIFAYGVLDVWLEHLGNQGGEWSHSDLQHLSIALLFLGGGLCGILTESKMIRRLLNSVRLQDPDAQKEEHQLSSYELSSNVFPALVVFITGIMMSSHHQPTMLATTIHAQWGALLAMFGIFRILTYMLLYLSPPTSTFPSRPLTELLASFSLMSGGFVFVCSNSETVNAMERRDIGSMFVLMLAFSGSLMVMAFCILVKAMTAISFTAARSSRTQ